MKILVVDDHENIVSSISNISPDAWDSFRGKSLELLSDQTDDADNAAMSLLISFMSNISGRSTDSLFLTAIPNETMDKFCKVLEIVDIPTPSSFLAHLIELSSFDALHVLRARSEGRHVLGHSFLIMGIPEQSIAAWQKLADVMGQPVGEIIGTIVIYGPKFNEEQSERLAAHIKDKGQ